MKKIDFYYRTSEAINSVFGSLDHVNKLFSKALVNFFVLKSASYRVFVDDHKKIKVEDIESILRNEKLTSKELFRVVIKVVIHWFFYSASLLSYKAFSGSYLNVLKTYVDVEYELFKSKALGEKHLVLVFPFPISISRQVDYIKSLKVESKSGKMSFSLYGIPYSFGSLVKVLIRRNSYALFELEYFGAIKLGDKLDKINFNNFMNMDDFESMSVVYNKHLRDGGHYVDTHLHGIGTYSPFISTNHLRAFNEAQSKFYTRNSDIPDLSYYYSSTYKPVESSIKEIVFYSQVTPSTMGLIEIEKLIIPKLKKISDEYDIHFLYKKHPNFINNRSDYLHGIDILNNENGRNLDTISLGMSLYSTTYYTEPHDFSMLLDVPEIPVRLLFSDDHLIVKECDLEDYFSRKFL